LLELYHLKTTASGSHENILIKLYQQGKENNLRT